MKTISKAIITLCLFALLATTATAETQNKDDGRYNKGIVTKITYP